MNVHRAGSSLSPLAQQLTNSLASATLLHVQVSTFIYCLTLLLRKHESCEDCIVWQEQLEQHSRANRRLSKAEAPLQLQLDLDVCKIRGGYVQFAQMSI